MRSVWLLRAVSRKAQGVTISTLGAAAFLEEPCRSERCVLSVPDDDVIVQFNLEGVQRDF